MNEFAARALRIEADFLTRAEASFAKAKGRLLRGTHWHTARTDETDRLRTLMVDRGLYDREELRKLPRNGRLVLHGYDPYWFFWRRRTGVAVASILAPLDEYLAPKDGPRAAPRSIGLVELVDHVKRLIVDEKTPHVIGVCSPTGFTEEAKNARLDLPNISLVLIEPRDDGGWTTIPVGDSADARICRLFDLEGEARQLTRIRQRIQERSGELLTGGLSATSLAEELRVPRRMVERAMEQMAAADPEMRLSGRLGEVLLFRGAPVATEEKAQMSMIDRIRRLFSSEGDEIKKLNALSERRALLAQRRDRIYNDIAKMEKREADLLEQGKAATSQVVRKRLAAQLAQHRRDIARQNTTASMLNQQINIVSTHIHNLTLIQQGELARLPDTEELTQDAVRAEELLEALRADAELVGSLETGIADTMTSEEELAILKEFEQPAEAARAEKAPPQAVTAAREDKEPLPEPASPEADSKRSEPEAT